MKIVNGFYFPDYDTQCSAAVFKELDKLPIILDYCNNLDAVIQAGGNVGTFPVALAKSFEHVYTFEPDDENWDCLIENTKGIDNIYCNPVGLSDSDGTGSMYQPDRADNCGSLAIKEGEGDILLVSIDSMVICDPVGLIYLDIEGSEFKALNGAKMTIEKYKPVIVIENKGLIPGFEEGGLQGSESLRDWICSLGYKYVTRLMRDDVFIPV